MKPAKHLVIAVIMLLACAALAVAADPVTVAVSVNGTPAPGATVTAQATVTINDGSTLQAIQWKQTGGVGVTLSNTTTDTVTIVLPERAAFKSQLVQAVEEQPIADANLPGNIPSPALYESGLQDRFMVVGVVPHALAAAQAITFDVTVTTSSGTYHAAPAVNAVLPWTTSVGIRNVPINVAVLLQGKKQATYDWRLTVPGGSHTALIDASSQNPEFTPDVKGDYTLDVTDLATGTDKTIVIHAGTWKGIITGTDSAGLPIVDSQCTSCHVAGTPRFDMFTPWKKTGHASIFTQNVVTPAGHYSTSCLECHTVGYSDTNLNNGGIAESASFTAFVNSGLLTHGAADNWKQILSTYPDIARKANIQCENCHGPQNSTGHMLKDDSRITYSSNMCGSCHGEPARHGRFQQWQLSMHSNFETAQSEGTNASCAKCHSAQGFVQWANNGFSSAAINVSWTTDDVQPQSCQTCHDPHDIGTASQQSATSPTDAKVRLSGTTPMLDAGFVAKDVGSAATCMVCHNSRRGLRDDAHFSPSSAAQASHVGPQADILMGQNLYFAKVGTTGYHGQIQDSCVTCHMEKTTAPSALALANVGTNHTFFASTSICTSCHSEITADKVQGPVEAKMESLKSGLETSLKTVMQTQLRLGNTIDVGGVKTLKSANEISGIELVESHGSQGLTVDLSNGSKIEAIAMTAVKVVRPGGSSVALYSVADPTIPKAGWNYFMIESDKSNGVHNPAFVNSALDVSIFAINTLNANATASVGGGAGSTAGLGGGLGNGAGAVSCTTPYVYWADIAAHAPGSEGSQWRTDLITRNLSASDAALTFYLHQANGATLQGNGSVFGGGQASFEDVVATMGGTNNIGALEICSNQPLLVAGRIFNQATGGTFGQNLDGKVADLGYGVGQTVSLIGLRQQTDVYRSNLTVTNGGTIEAQVAVTLYDATGKSLIAYNLTVPAGQVVQDNEPFMVRAGAPNVGWGFATVTVLKGNNVLSQASVVDDKTNDPTTVPPKQ